MAKPKAKKIIHKAVSSKPRVKAAGRPKASLTVEAKNGRKTTLVMPHTNGTNGASHPAGREGAADGATDPKVLDAGTIKTKSGVDLTEKVRELLLLAKEQGHLTYDDINDALPDNVVTPEDLDQIYTKLANLEIEIVDQAEVDRVKQPEVGGGGGKGAAGHFG